MRRRARDFPVYLETQETPCVANAVFIVPTNYILTYFRLCDVHEK